MSDKCPSCGQEIHGGYYALQTHKRNCVSHGPRSVGGKWIRASKKNPCPVCGKPSWCGFTHNGEAAHCMRVESEHPTPKSGGWIHKLTGDDRVEYDPPPPKKKPKVDWNKLAYDCFVDENAARTRRALCCELGVSVESLISLGVGFAVDDHRRSDVSTWPEFDHNHQVVGITRRYREPVAMWEGGDESVTKLAWPGSEHGMFYRSSWLRGHGPIFLPEGGSDAAMLITIGLRAIGRPSCRAGIDHLAQLLVKTNEPVCVIGEWDEKPERRGGDKVKSCTSACTGCFNCWPGMSGARHTAIELAKKIPQRVVWCMVPGAKDVREWFFEMEEPTGEAFINQAREDARCRMSQ